MVTAPRLVTRRLALEPLTMADVPAIYDIAKEKGSIEDFQYVAHSLDDVKAWLEPSYRDPTVLTWVIRKQERAIGLSEVCFEAEYSDLETNVCRVGYFLDWNGTTRSTTASTTTWPSHLRPTSHHHFRHPVTL